MTTGKFSARQWDDFIHDQPRAHALQLHAWGALKADYGWDVARVALQDGGRIVAGAQVLFRPLPLKLGAMAYLPMGFYAPPERAAELWKAIHRAARKRGARFLKWEPGVYHDDALAPDFAALGFRPSPQTIQPPNTIIIDIDADDETILARMNQGTRRKIRQGAKKGVRFYQGTADDIDAFNAMMGATGARNEFGVHSADYYRRAFELFSAEADRESVALFMATHEGDMLAGIMVAAVGADAWYLYGASSDIKRNLMATYGVQWEAIRWARARGCQRYDLWGIPDADEATLEAEFETRSDDLWGVYGFKRGWGGHVVRSAGAWDYVYQPAIYSAYRLALRMRG